MKITEMEMRGLITGKAMPADIFVGESLAAYFLRKFTNLHTERDALAAENSALKSAIVIAKEGLQEHYDTDGVDSQDSEGNFMDACIRLCDAQSTIEKLENIQTPATDAYLNSVRAEGIHFAANRMLAAWDAGFIDDTPAQAYDISGAVLTAIEFLPNASPEEFKRNFADSIRSEIKASTAGAGKDGE